ncbi:MAG: hypothetical protein AB1599_03470 [Planctomycetota bacterium]
MVTKRDIISIILKVIGVKFICAAIIGAIGFPFMFSMRGVFEILIFCGVVFIIGLSIVLLSNMIAGKLVPADKELKVISGYIVPRDIFIIIMKIIWMFALIAAVEFLIGLACGMKQDTRWIATNIVSALFGIYFLTGAKHLVKLLFDRDQSTPKQADNPEGSVK